MKKQFEEIKIKNPNLSSCMCFVKLVKDKKITTTSLRFYFNTLVDKDDYKGSNKEEIIKWLIEEIIQK